KAEENITGRVLDIVAPIGKGLRRADDQPALAFADRRDDVEHAPGNVLFRLDIALELELLVGMERREDFKKDLVLGGLGGLAVDLVDLDEGEVALAVLRRADL